MSKEEWEKEILFRRRRERTVGGRIRNRKYLFKSNSVIRS
jgi:hypothetical protein